mmetsp:Transcript_10131/g.23109  ORF Transcript_10131/g.23109 Transcript_10131/m.23109 type:complete len:239 (-) Transcript_10131:184-900(-)
MHPFSLIELLVRGCDEPGGGTALAVEEAAAEAAAIFGKMSNDDTLLLISEHISFVTPPADIDRFIESSLAAQSTGFTSHLGCRRPAPRSAARHPSVSSAPPGPRLPADVGAYMTEEATPGSDRSQVAARLSALSPATSVAAFPPNGGFIAAKWRTYAKVHSVSFSAGRRVLTALAADLPSQRPTFSFELLYGLLGAGAGLANQVAPLLLLHLGAPPSAHCDEGGGELLRTLRVSLYSS